MTDSDPGDRPPAADAADAADAAGAPRADEPDDAPAAPPSESVSDSVEVNKIMGGERGAQRGRRDGGGDH